MVNVLFVEDEAVMRSAFRKMMDWEASDFALAAAVANGAEALAYIENNPVDIVITDLKMPVMDGLELIETLQDRGFQGIILVLSNYTDFELVRTALTRGASDYMLKVNIDGDTLRKQLESAAAMLEHKNPSGRETVYKKEIRDAIQFIQAHFTERITLDDVAGAVKLNRSYLSRLFKHETGGHMFGFINDLRMKKAAELICGGDITVSEVAEAVGIDDQFYFARVFKKHFGIPPSEYRRQLTINS
ncbi:MAG: response regulator [Oscillospiraceae bacterium]|nr:response regulator [Oscillospiraceae bacterium]